MAAGRPVVSTPFACAAELLGGGRGVLAGAGSPTEWTAALSGLLENDAHRTAIGRSAYEHTRSTVWSSVGADYRRLFARIAAAPLVTVPPASLVGVARG
jgi:glycosyltransferase involved in cell wall biosynthesis